MARSSVPFHLKFWGSCSLTVDQLAAVLQEPNVELLRQALAVLGPAHTAQLLAQTLDVEATGGLLVTNGTRRRTPGGVFFHLVRQQVTRSQREYLFPRPAPQTPQAQAPVQAQPQALTWDEVSPLIATLATHPAGEARTMKVTLINLLYLPLLAPIASHNLL